MGYLAFAAVAFAILSVIAALVYVVVAVWVRGVQKIVVAWRAAPHSNRVTFVVTMSVCLVLTAGLLSLVPWGSLFKLLERVVVQMITLGGESAAPR